MVFYLGLSPTTTESPLTHGLKTQLHFLFLPPNGYNSAVTQLAVKGIIFGQLKAAKETLISSIIAWP